METHVSIVFSNFTMPTMDCSSELMELTYENKMIKFGYPLTEPLKLNFSQKFIHDKINLIVSVIDPHRKNRVISRGDIVLYKNIFLDNSKTTYEKNITMFPLDGKDMKKAGRIFLQMQLLDSFDEWKKNMKTMTKKKTNPKLGKNTTSSPNNNENNAQNNPQFESKEVFNDNISEINVSHIEEDPELKNSLAELDKLISLDHINQLKNILQNDYKNILPNDANELKNLNENLYQKYRILSNNYNEILQNLNNSNENMRQKAVEFYTEYKKLKKELYQKRLELKNNKKSLETQIQKNKQENDKINSNLQKFNNEQNLFLEKLSQKSGGEINNSQNLAVVSSGTGNNDIKMLREALKKISSLGYDLIDGLNITDDEKKILSVVVGVNFDSYDSQHAANGVQMENNGQEEMEENEDIEADKENYDLSNQIVALIERDVNDLYMRKLIEQVKIDQIDAITYSFTGNTNSKDVAFKIENNNLVCNTGESFTVWLINNFGL